MVRKNWCLHNVTSFALNIGFVYKLTFTKLYGALWRQREYTLDKPARDAAAKLKAEADAEEASRAAEIPLHDENEWNIR